MGGGCPRSMCEQGSRHPPDRTLRAAPRGPPRSRRSTRGVIGLVRSPTRVRRPPSSVVGNAALRRVLVSSSSLPRAATTPSRRWPRRSQHRRSGPTAGNPAPTPQPASANVAPTSNTHPRVRCHQDLMSRNYRYHAARSSKYFGSADRQRSVACRFRAARASYSARLAGTVIHGPRRPASQ